MPVYHNIQPSGKIYACVCLFTTKPFSHSRSLILSLLSLYLIISHTKPSISLPSYLSYQALESTLSRVYLATERKAPNAIFAFCDKIICSFALGCETIFCDSRLFRRNIILFAGKSCGSKNIFTQGKC